MMKKVIKNKTNKKTYLIMFFGIIVGVIISIASSYVIAETLIKSADVSYVDNSKLGATNVQAAIDGTCTKFSNDLQSFLLKVYPVGSIYISYDSTNPGTLFGGTWEVFGKGQTLVGIDSSQTEFSSVGKTGGTKSVSTTLKETNLPSHTHIIPALSGNTSNADLKGKIAPLTYFNVTDTSGVFSLNKAYLNLSASVVTEKGMFGTAIYDFDASHSHTVTTTASATTTCTNCNGTAFSTSTLQPYVTVYMWRRTN